MKYLLFISYSSGLKHNCIYNSLDEAAESIEQLMEEEGLNNVTENTLSIAQLAKHLSDNDDFFHQLSTGTWYHLQLHPVFAKPKVKEK
ncbi:MAG: hypothetical protein HY738_09800 [Bacteroidia bacterium]|nr:hypothetical protein [Bacteroidia bacterium]